jgi:hypothetical protein
MIGEFLARLAVALPLVCGLAVLLLVAVRRGWIVLPEFALQKRPRGSSGRPAAAAVEVVAVKAVSPACRVAVVRFDGRELLLGVGGQGAVVLAEGGLPAVPEAAPSPAPVLQGNI